MSERGTPPVRIKSGLYRVVVELEESRAGDNGELLKKRVEISRNQPRGTAEHLARLTLRDGVRIDAHEGVRFLSPMRIREVRLMRDEEEWT